MVEEKRQQRKKNEVNPWPLRKTRERIISSELIPERCSVPAYGVYGSTRRPTSYPAPLWVWRRVLSL